MKYKRTRKRYRVTKNKNVLYFITSLIVIAPICFILWFSSIKTSSINNDMSSEIDSKTNSIETQMPTPAETIPETTEPQLTEMALYNISSSVKSSLDSKITSKFVILYDKTNSQIVYSKNANIPAYPASTTKLLTALVALENANLSDEIVVGDELLLVQPGSSLAHVKQGTSYTLEQLLHAMLLPSGNDAAYVIATNIGRKALGDYTLPPADSIKQFAKMMNEYAQGIGLEYSNFSNPDGFHDSMHYTTAEDMLLIGLKAMENPTISQICAKTDEAFTLSNGEQVEWLNSNKLVLYLSRLYYPKATGMKTGFTDEAGFCLVSTAKDDGRELICVLLGGVESDARWQESIDLFEFAFSLDLT